MELYPFQQTAADTIASRVLEYIEQPTFRGRSAGRRRVPFVQFLTSITASGKTVILAESVAQIAALSAVKPVVLWLSKLTVVVEQSLASLEPGGQYFELINEYQVRPLGELSRDELSTTDSPFLYFATTGTFNRGDKEGRKVFSSSLDDADESIWDSLRLRADANSTRRPLVVVYDEAHNLTDQQTELLLGLEPDAFILSTATARVRPLFQAEVLEPLKKVGEYVDEELNTIVAPSHVAASGLVKQRVDLIGRQNPMQDVITEMVDELEAAGQDAVDCGLVGRPKAVYVCRTNITEGDDKRTDNAKQPFNQRQAPPILIWRHLVEELNVDPSTIAVYCNLTVDKGYPMPEGFVLFKGGEKDYQEFAQGQYEHIIFNQSLTEGWDDPLVYFAYIDKTLGSTIQAEQIVGRLLRQPGRQRYESDRLNAAQIHIRVESNKVFDDVVDRTQSRLRDDLAPVTVTRTNPGERYRLPLKPQSEQFVPDIATHTEDAIDEMAQIADQTPDFTQGGGNTDGVGRKTLVQRIVGSSDAPSFEWEEIGTSSKVIARWLFSRSLRRIHNDAAAAVTLHDAKWDARIGVGSPAATTLEQYAERVGLTFISESYLEIADLDDEDYLVGEILIREEGAKSFKNALHERYDGLNKLEESFADTVDELDVPWCRNPSRSGYGIPIIKRGGNDTFYPDFLVWTHGDVYAVDTKGSHLFADAMAKLIRIRASPGRPMLHIRFIVEGNYDKDGKPVSDDGFTVVGYRPDGEKSFSAVTSMTDAVAGALKKLK